MQVQRGEERELVFRNARVQLRLRPVQIGLNLAFQLLEDGQVIGMNAMLGKLLHVAGHILMILVVIRIEFFFVPVQNDLQLVDAALDGLDLVVGVAVKAHAGGRVGIFGVPYQVGHHALILAAGDQRVAADLGIGFNDQHGVAVLRSLSGRGDAGAASAHDNHIIGSLDGVLRFIGEGLGPRLQRRHIAAGLLRCRVDGIKDRAAGKRCAGDAVHAGGGVFNDLGEQNVVGNIAHMLCLRRGDDLDRLDGVLREGDAQHHVAVVTGGSALIGARREGDLRRLLRLTPGLSKGAAYSGLDGVAGDGRTGHAVHALGVGLSHIRRAHLLDGRAAQRRGFTLAGDFNRGDRFFVHGQLNAYSAAEALRGGLVVARSKRCSASSEHRAQQHDRKHDARPFPDVHPLFPPVIASNGSNTIFTITINYMDVKKLLPIQACRDRDIYRTNERTNATCR